MLQRQNKYFHEGERFNYPPQGSEKHHRSVERGHDEKIENAILENCLHQPGHSGLAMVSFKLEDEDDDANEGDKVCRVVRPPDIYETGRNKYLRRRPATCKSMWSGREQ